MPSASRALTHKRREAALAILRGTVKCERADQLVAGTKPGVFLREGWSGARRERKCLAGRRTVAGRIPEPVGPANEDAAIGHSARCFKPMNPALFASNTFQPSGTTYGSITM